MRLGPAPGDRTFGLQAPSADPELENLLGLARFLVDDIDTAVALSAITGPKLRSRFPAGSPHIEVIDCRSGLRLQADMSDIFAASAALGRLQEADDFDAVMSLVEPGAVVIDVGANFGLYAAHAALYAGETGSVFAFDPMPEAFALLEANIAGNGLVCTTVRAAVGAQNGVSSFRLAADSSFSGLKDTGRSITVGAIDVEVIALDAFAPLARIRPDLIKIDVEGGEQAVLRGARKLLSRSPDVVVMFEFSYKNLDDVSRAELIAEIDDLANLGFALYCRTPDGVGAQRIAAADLQGERSENLFLVRPESPAAARLQAAMERPALTPTLEQAATIAVLKRFDSLWRAADQMTRTISETAAADFSLTLTSDAMSNFKGYRDAAQEASKQMQATIAAQARELEKSGRVSEQNADLRARLDDELERSRQSRASLDAHRAERASIGAKYEEASTALAKVRDDLTRAKQAQASLAATVEAKETSLNAHRAELAAAGAKHRDAVAMVEAKEILLTAHRAELANTRAKYEDASAARDWLLRQIAELKARHGIEEPEPGAAG